MKIKFLCLLLIFTCCKQPNFSDEDVNHGELIVERNNFVSKEDVLEIALDILVSEDDEFEVFYTSQLVGNSFINKNRIVTKIKGSKNYQTIMFTLPEGVVPDKFRIDLGDNALKNVTNIDIKAIKLKLNDKAIIINQELLDHFFIANDYLKNTGLSFARVVNDGKYDPYLLASPVLLTKMQLEY